MEGTIYNLFNLINLRLSKPLKKTLVQLITCLLENNKAHLCKLGDELAVDGPSKNACVQRIHRFLSNKRITPSLTVVPLIYLMRPFLESLPKIVLSYHLFFLSLFLFISYQTFKLEYTIITITDVYDIRGGRTHD